jgi:hypothetical protein
MWSREPWGGGIFLESAFRCGRATTLKEGLNKPYLDGPDRDRIIGRERNRGER